MANIEPASPPGWLGPIVRTLAPLIPKSFCGSLEIRVGPGGVTTISVQQTFRGGDLHPPGPRPRCDDSTNRAPR